MFWAMFYYMSLSPGIHVNVSKKSDITDVIGTELFRHSSDIKGIVRENKIQEAITKIARNCITHVQPCHRPASYQTVAHSKKTKLSLSDQYRMKNCVF